MSFFFREDLAARATRLTWPLMFLVAIYYVSNQKKTDTFKTITPDSAIEYYRNASPEIKELMEGVPEMFEALEGIGGSRNVDKRYLEAYADLVGADPETIEEIKDHMKDLDNGVEAYKGDGVIIPIWARAAGAILLGVVLYTYFVISDPMVCIVSSIDDNKYCVRKQPISRRLKTVDLLANVNKKLKKLVLFAKENYPRYPNIQLLAKRFVGTKVNENLPTEDKVAYSQNKGEKMAFCTTTRRNGTTPIDENTLIYIAIHELAHIMSLSYGHTKEFLENFKFLLDIAKEANIHNPIDYKNEPGLYCGMKLTDNPYYDL